MLVIGIIIMFLCVGLTPIVTSKVLIKNIDKESELLSSGAGTEYWAVMAGVAKYENPKFYLPIFKGRLKVLYDSLLDANNWKKDHIILLTNEEATRTNILKSLDIMANNVDFNDVFLFSFQGHGAAIPDEAPFDENDGTDEVICPYDFDITTDGTYVNCITDDELNEKFTKIEGITFKQTKGSLLVFESCFSGALVDKKWQFNIDDKKYVNQEGLEEFKKEFTEELEDPPEGSGADDVNGRKRFIIMASWDSNIAAVLTGFGGPIHAGLAAGFRGYADGIGIHPKNNIVTAEEGYRLTKRLFKMGITSYIGSFCTVLFVLEYAVAKLGGMSNEEALLIALASVGALLVLTSVDLIYIELAIKLKTGYWLLSIPNKIDSNPLVELPIIEIEKNYLSPDPVPNNWQPTKPITPEGRVLGQPGQIYEFTTFSVDPINPDQDSSNAKLKYMWDWGDGKTSDWLGPYESESGNKIKASHAWEKEGGYSIKVKVKDTNGVESDWSDTLGLVISKSRPFHPISVLERLIFFIQNWDFSLLTKLILK